MRSKVSPAERPMSADRWTFTLPLARFAQDTLGQLRACGYPGRARNAAAVRGMMTRWRRARGLHAPRDGQAVRSRIDGAAGSPAAAAASGCTNVSRARPARMLSLIHISEPTRLL